MFFLSIVFVSAVDPRAPSSTEVLAVAVIKTVAVTDTVAIIEAVAVSAALDFAANAGGDN